MSTVDSIEPSGWICVTRVLPCAIDATWSWFTGYGGYFRSISVRICSRESWPAASSSLRIASRSAACVS